MYLELNFRRGLFNAKTPNLTPFRPTHWGGGGGASTSGRQKIERHKKFLEFNFREGLVYAKILNFKIVI
jgi:hypothetical protein